MSGFLRPIDPMGIYDTLYAFQEACGHYMGEPGTHPWSQGYPLTSQLPAGPVLPDSVSLTAEDLKYPKAWGNAGLRKAIAGYYQRFYAANITAENVMIFAGGRPAILTVLLLLAGDVHVLCEETEYTPYWDMLNMAGCDYGIVPSNIENNFSPGTGDYGSMDVPGRAFALKSNPCNPTGITWTGNKLAEFVKWASADERGALIDEAYEMFIDPEPESALRHIADINTTNIFIAGAATKGLQAPGIRIGWIVAAEQHVKLLSNYSTFGMGGVSRLSQLYAEALLAPERVEQARAAVVSFYGEQRERYAKAISALGVELFTGVGGFYHWGRLPGDLTALEFNQRLFQQQAAILPGPLCDMLRRRNDSPLSQFFRFSFGALTPDSFESDCDILKTTLAE